MATLSEARSTMNMPLCSLRNGPLIRTSRGARLGGSPKSLNALLAPSSAFHTSSRSASSSVTSRRRTRSVMRANDALEGRACGSDAAAKALPSQPAEGHEALDGADHREERLKPGELGDHRHLDHDPGEQAHRQPAREPRRAPVMKGNQQCGGELAEPVHEQQEDAWHQEG